MHSALDFVAVALLNEIECLLHSIAFVVSEVDSVVFAVAEFGCPERMVAAAAVVLSENIETMLANHLEFRYCFRSNSDLKCLYD